MLRPEQLGNRVVPVLKAVSSNRPAHIHHPLIRLRIRQSHVEMRTLDTCPRTCLFSGAKRIAGRHEIDRITRLWRPASQSLGTVGSMTWRLVRGDWFSAGSGAERDTSRATSSLRL